MAYIRKTPIFCFSETWIVIVSLLRPCIGKRTHLPHLRWPHSFWAQEGRSALGKARAAPGNSLFLAGQMLAPARLPSSHGLCAHATHPSLYKPVPFAVSAWVYSVTSNNSGQWQRNRHSPVKTRYGTCSGTILAFIQWDLYIYIYVSVCVCVYVYIYKIHRNDYWQGLHKPGNIWCRRPRAPAPDPARDFLHELDMSPRPDPVKHTLLIWISNINFQTWVPEILSSFWVELLFAPWKIMQLPSVRLKFPITWKISKVSTFM